MPKRLGPGFPTIRSLPKHAYVCLSRHVCMCVCMYACMHACIHACMHLCMYVCTYVRTYVRMYVCTRAILARTQARGLTDCHPRTQAQPSPAGLVTISYYSLLVFLLLLLLLLL